jgi:hypothetical protein
MLNETNFLMFEQQMFLEFILKSLINLTRRLYMILFLKMRRKARNT